MSRSKCLKIKPIAPTVKNLGGGGHSCCFRAVPWLSHCPGLWRPWARCTCHSLYASLEKFGLDTWFYLLFVFAIVTIHQLEQYKYLQCLCHCWFLTCTEWGSCTLASYFISSHFTTLGRLLTSCLSVNWFSFCRSTIEVEDLRISFEVSYYACVWKILD